MAKLLERKQRIAIGCYYTLKPGIGLTIHTSLDIKWYGWPFLMWKVTNKDLYKWYEYPWLFLLIGKHTVLKWVGYAS